MNAHPYQTILAIIGNTFDAHAAMLFLPMAENKEKLSLVSSWCPTQMLVEDTIIESGKSYIGLVMRDFSESIFLVDHNDIISTNFPYYDDSRMPEIQTFLACPVLGGGVLVIDSIEKEAFNEDIQKIFALFAKLIPQIQTMTATSSYSLQISTYFYALEAIRTLKERNVPWNEFLKAILKISSEATGLEYAVFVSKNEDNTKHIIEAENVPLLLTEEKALEIDNTLTQQSHAGLIAWVLKNEESIFNDGLSQASTHLFSNIKDLPKFPMTLSLTIKVENAVCAALCLASQKAKPINQEMRMFSNLVATEISQYLERLTMRHRIRNALKK